MENEEFKKRFSDVIFKVYQFEEDIVLVIYKVIEKEIELDSLKDKFKKV